MTNIYKPINDDGYELCHPVNERTDFSTIRELIDGIPRASIWTPIKMKLWHEDEGRQLKKSDSPWLGSGSLIFRQHVAELLSPLLLQYGELLPLECDEANLVIYNVTCRLDALDEEASSTMKLPSGHIVHVYKYVFREDAIGQKQIFKLSTFAGAGPTFLGVHFIELWQRHGFEGLKFQDARTKKFLFGGAVPDETIPPNK